MFAGRVPKAAEVSALGSGDKGFGYKGSSFHRIISGFFYQGNKLHTLWWHWWQVHLWEKYQDGNFILKHPGSDISSMENAGPDANGCSFFAYIAKPEWLDGKPGSLGEWTRAGALWKSWNSLGPETARAARRSPLLTTGISNSSDMCVTSSRPFFRSSGECPSSLLLTIPIIFEPSLRFFRVHIFLIPSKSMKIAELSLWL